jgi:hypothetical protein
MTPEERREAVRLRVAKHRAKKKEGVVPMSMAERVACMQEGRKAANIERAKAKAKAQIERAAAQTEHEQQRRPAPIAEQVITPAMTQAEYMRRYYLGNERRPGDGIKRHQELVLD